jgi:hypothetical protein
VAAAVFGRKDVKWNADYAFYEGIAFGAQLLVSKYSRDWAAAGQVVERLVALGYSFDTSWFRKDGWYAAFHKDDDAWEEYGETAPHAISLAALAALAGEDEDLAYHAAVHNLHLEDE